MVQTEALTELAGQSVVLTYSNVAAEYDALRRRAIVVNRSHRARMRFMGAQSAAVLNGLVTNDVTALAAGQGQYAAALTAKGKVVADFRVLRLEDSYLTDVAPRARDAWSGLVRKYVNPRLSRYVDESSAIQTLGVFGVQARYVVEQITGIGHSALALLTPYSHVQVAHNGVTMIVMRAPDLELEGYELFVPSEHHAAVWDAAVAARATPAGLAAWEVARVEAGRPEHGIDMDETTIAQEANLEELGAISYTKGCYTGQETVARVHFRGHVNRSLRRLHFVSAAVPPTNAELMDDAGNVVGDVRSVALSPRHGGVAIAMVRREVAPGTTLHARWEGGECTVQIAAQEKGATG